MDSVSQMLLGAACGELVLGRRVGRRAILIGAVLGTLPDLDVLVPYEDAIDSFTYHRSWSHSVFVLTAASVPIAALARRVAGGERGRAVPYGLWLLGVWLILFTHPLLDSFTTYGTQIWWPLPLPPVAIGSVFIIDPLYTLPLAVGVIWAWRRRDARGRAANRVGLLLGTVYLGLTLLSQAHAGRVARASLAAESAVEPPPGPPTNRLRGARAGRPPSCWSRRFRSRCCGASSLSTRRGGSTGRAGTPCSTKAGGFASPTTTPVASCSTSSPGTGASRVSPGSRTASCGRGRTPTASSR